MRKFIGIAASALMASSFVFSEVASADSTAATCEFYSHGDKKKDRSGPCSFSQRQVSLLKNRSSTRSPAL